MSIWPEDTGGNGADEVTTPSVGAPGPGNPDQVERCPVPDRNRARRGGRVPTVREAAAAVTPGWPRRAAPCAADLGPDGEPRPGRPGGRPTPWAAAVDTTTGIPSSWDPWLFDEDRADRMRAEDLCQVCGAPRGAEVFVLAPQPRRSPWVTMYGGALCSMRCAALTAAACPHYRDQARVGVCQVPRQSRVDMLGVGGSANDDEYDLAADLPIRVLAMRSTRAGDA